MSMNYSDLVKSKFVLIRNGRSKPVVLMPEGSGRTKQAFRDQVNINKIVERSKAGQLVTHLNGRQPFYGDVSDMKDYQYACDLVVKAEGLFEQMSSKVRQRFDNDPSKMIAFLQDKDNLEEAEKLGMVVRRPADPPKAPEAPPAVPEPPK